jgi:hypothetical protein
MDRAEAIWYLHPIADSASLERYKEALNLAIAALREQEQRAQGCGWCDHFELDPQYLIGEGNGMYKELIFQFCPMCGRKLKEGAEG